MAKVRLEALDLEILLVFFGAGLLLFFLMVPLGRVLGMRPGDRTVFALAGTFSNGVGIGIPFVSYAFGEAGVVPVGVSLAPPPPNLPAPSRVPLGTPGAGRRARALPG